MGAMISTILAQLIITWLLLPSPQQCSNGESGCSDIFFQSTHRPVVIFEKCWFGDCGMVLELWILEASEENALKCTSNLKTSLIIMGRLESLTAWALVRIPFVAQLLLLLKSIVPSPNLLVNYIIYTMLPAHSRTHPGAVTSHHSQYHITCSRLIHSNTCKGSNPIWRSSNTIRLTWHTSKCSTIRSTWSPKKSRNQTQGTRECSSRQWSHASNWDCWRLDCSQASCKDL